MTTEPTDFDVAVCLCTFRRPEMLNACLTSLSTQQIQDVKWRIVVVDNDPAATAREAVERFATQTTIPVKYLVEPTPGIPWARNAAVRGASGAQFIAFLDDDEVADSNWLASLVSGQSDFLADVIQGSVSSQLDDGGPAWVRRGRFFELQPMTKGVQLETAATNNVLIRNSALSDLNGPFDIRYGMTGGDDTHLFCCLRKNGGSIIAFPEAKVTETVPVTRQSVRWLWTRALRSGATYTQVQRDVIQEKFWRWRRLAAIASRAVRGMAFVLTGILTLRFDRVVKGIVHFAVAIGTMSGLLHIQINEYKRPKLTGVS